MTRPALLINGVPMPEAPRVRVRRPEPPPKSRIFDHLADAPPEQDAFFSRVARRMRSSVWWHEVSPRTEPQAVSGGGRMRLIIAGSRTVSPSVEDIDAAAEALLYEASIPLCADHTYRDRITEVISGDAAGADTAGSAWARERGIPIHHEPVTPADYALGRYIGPRMRNRRMAGRGDALLAFRDGISGGTSDMVTRMIARGKPVRVVPCRTRTQQRKRAQSSSGKASPA